MEKKRQSVEGVLTTRHHREDMEGRIMAHKDVHILMGRAYKYKAT